MSRKAIEQNNCFWKLFERCIIPSQKSWISCGNQIYILYSLKSRLKAYIMQSNQNKTCFFISWIKHLRYTVLKVCQIKHQTNRNFNKNSLLNWRKNRRFPFMLIGNIKWLESESSENLIIQLEISNLIYILEL